MEPDFGLLEYVSHLPRIECVLKQRYADFIVREIALDKRVIQLSKLDYVSDECTTDLIISTPMPNFLNESIVQEMDTLAKSRDKNATLEIDSDNFDKTQRTHLHQAIRLRYNNKLNSTTKTNTDSKKQVMIVSRENCQTNERKRACWPENRPNYCHFVMFKENKDQHQALSLIAKFSGSKPGNLQTAGTKDRRAVTTQKVCLFRCKAERLAATNRLLRGIKVGDFSYEHHDLGLGDLWGNQFTVVLRNVTGIENQSEFDISIEKWKQAGFINYYGMQRFGSFTVPTHQIGRLILKGDWEAAVNAILSLRDEPEALEKWQESKDANAAFSALPRGQQFSTIEGQLLTGLKRFTRDGKCNFKSALMTLPRNSRNLYVHSYQSFLWNRVASRRVRNFGRKIIEGDLLMDQVKKTTRRALSIDVQSGNSWQIQLPLPSTSMEMPDNEVANWYAGLMAEDGITCESFSMLKNDFAVDGASRHLFVTATDVSREWIRYTDATIALSLTDLDLVLDPDAVPARSVVDGHFLALRLQFSLPAGVYATVALRELTRTDMGKQSQKSLNDYAPKDAVHSSK